jgi:hypothetical protein
LEVLVEYWPGRTESNFVNGAEKNNGIINAMRLFYYIDWM